MFDFNVPALSWSELQHRWSSRQARQLLGLAVMAGLVGWLVVSIWFHHGDARVTNLPATSTIDLPMATVATTATAAPLQASSQVSSGDIVVQVSGAVMTPGIYHVGVNARGVDAVDAAGGFTGEADRDAVNLAGKLADGQYFYVPRKGQTSLPTAALASAAAQFSSTTIPTSVNINTASAQELQNLPGVGPATANAILAYRTQHGPFRSIDDIGKVKGIGPAKLSQLRSVARV